MPYDILKPILEKATTDQLYMLEHHNPYLMEDTDELWQAHCQKDFRNYKREEMETFREMYLRCMDERESRLKALTANIKLAQDKSTPVRQTKLAYVDCVAKPPRGVAKKQVSVNFLSKCPVLLHINYFQAKNGILNISQPAVTPASRLSSSSKPSMSSKSEVVSVPPPPRTGGGHQAHLIKPKKAPLMQKTLAFMKGRFGRR